MGKVPRWTCLQRRYTIGKKAHKMLNTNEIPLCTPRVALMMMIGNNKTGECMEKLEKTFCTSDGHEKWCCHFLK